MGRQDRILIVDDDPSVLEALHQTFLDEYDVVLAASGEEALCTIEGNSDIDTIILDIRMAKTDGLETASRIRERDPDIPVIFHTGFPGDYSESEIDKRHQPFDYVGKNERPERLIRAVRNAVSLHRLMVSGSELIQLARDHYGMIGRSRVMRDVFQTIERIGPTVNKVMILGPTGSGKELVARALHSRSRRAGNRLVILNCNHKAPDLVESELFGHLRGSFTGATADRVGMFEHADSGTLFLDEVGDLDITTQGKLLRVLETGEMRRIGSMEIIKVDVRVICATHRDIETMVAEGSFREDLYYRINGIKITLPPLKERRDDIPELIDFFTREYCAKTGHSVKVFEPSARDLLIEYDWPGNVRQLMDSVQSLIDLCPSHLITRTEVVSYLSFEGNSGHRRSGFSDRVREYKKLLVVQALARHDNNVSAAARELSLDRSNLSKMLKDFGIETG